MQGFAGRTRACERHLVFLFLMCATGVQGWSLCVQAVHVLVAGE
jgi:hypothetical protein